MYEPIQHYKIILKNETTISRPNVGRYNALNFTEFREPYFQNLWLIILSKHKETFRKIVKYIRGSVYIPIYKAHKMPLKEQSQLFHLIKELESETIRFNFFDMDFNNFQFKDSNLNNLLNEATNVQVMHDKFFNSAYFKPKFIELGELSDTIEDIEFQIQDDEHKFKAPIEFVNKLKIVHRMRQCYLTKPLTYMVYQIMQKILTKPKDFDLLYQCLYPADPSKGIKRCEERSQYKALCEKYGKPEIQYLFKQHFQ